MTPAGIILLLLAIAVMLISDFIGEKLGYGFVGRTVKIVLMIFGAIVVLMLIFAAQ